MTAPDDAALKKTLTAPDDAALKKTLTAPIDIKIGGLGPLGPPGPNGPPEVPQGNINFHWRILTKPRILHSPKGGPQ